MLTVIILAHNAQVHKCVHFIVILMILLLVSHTVEAVAALGNKVVETLRTQDPAEGRRVF